MPIVANFPKKSGVSGAVVESLTPPENLTLLWRSPADNKLRYWDGTAWTECGSEMTADEALIFSAEMELVDPLADENNAPFTDNDGKIYII